MTNDQLLGTYGPPIIHGLKSTTYALPCAYHSDVTIERNCASAMGRTVLRDSEGDTIATFAAQWNDEDIMAALDLANRFYGRGVERGMDDKARELRKALQVYP